MSIVTPLKARLELDTSGYTKGIEAAANGAKSLTAVTDGVAKKSSGSVIAMTGGVGAAVKGMAFSATLATLAVAAGIAAIIASVVALGVAIVRWGISMWDTLAASTRPFSAFHDKMLELQTAINGLRGAFYAMFVNLLAAALPTILIVINWLTKMLNVLSMVIAALTGQKMVYQAITVAATQAGNAAKGALAGFDQLDVLANNNNLLQFQQVPIDPGILEMADKIKKLWQTIQDGWNLLWTNPGEFFNQFWRLVVSIATTAWSFVTNWVTTSWNNLSDTGKILLVILGSIALSWILVTLVLNAGSIAMGIAAAAMGVWNIMAGIGTGITAALGVALTSVDWPLVLIIIGIGLLIAGIILLIMYWPQVSKATKDALGKIALFAMSIFNTVTNFVNGILILIISGLNSVISAFDSVSGLYGGVNIPLVPTFQLPLVSIPGLAEGAVIPSNAPFMAVLGDQKSGTNIEAPASLIRSILQEEIGNIKADISLSFEGNLAALVRELKPHIDKENVRMGNSLVRNTGMIQL